jgi:polysaccharide export outer membrane protein
MRIIRKVRWQEWVVLVVAALMLTLFAPLPGKGAEQEEPKSYVLGPGDIIQVSVLDMEEVGKYPNRIDLRGFINLPVVGRVEAAGLTSEQLEAKIRERLRTQLKAPDVTVSITEMRSQPVSVLGAVTQPGVQQVQGRKTLMEVISQAGGLRPDAGHAIRIARGKDWGALPLEGVKEDETGAFWVAEVGVSEIMAGGAPHKNIPVRPNDVITVPKGRLVYVMGAVKKTGGFVLGERSKVTVLEAISMAEGMDRFSREADSRIMRKTSDPNSRVEIAVNVKRILSGKDKDVELEPDDILYIPDSGVKRATARSIEAAIQIGTGIAIWGNR